MDRMQRVVQYVSTGRAQWIRALPLALAVAGLGLAIVENIIIGHGGVISVRSEPGHAAAFTVDLPLTAAVAATSATEDGAA